MKKTLAIVTALVLCTQAFAQAPKENVLFKHWSVGAGIGLPLDGLNIQVATTILPNLQGRILYTDFSPVVSIADPIVQRMAGFGIKPFQYTITDINYHDKGLNIDEADLEGTVQQRDLSLLVDFFPGNGGFHLTGGVMFSMTPKLVTATGTPKSTNGKPVFEDESDKGGTEFYGISTDKEGKVHAAVQYGTGVKPYLGIGFGRPVSLKHRVGVNFDMGVAYIGGVHVMSKTYYKNPDGKDVELNKAWIDSNPDLKDNIPADTYKQVEKWLPFANSFPVLPYLRFTINVRLF